MNRLFQSSKTWVGLSMLAFLLRQPGSLSAQQQINPVHVEAPAGNAVQAPVGESKEAAQAAPEATGEAPQLLVSAGDLIQVTVFDTPELSAQMRVDQKGDVTVPWGESLHVAGMAPAQVATMIQGRLQEEKILKFPHNVTVFVAEYATQGVNILGQVKSPGVYPVLGIHHLYDVLAMAGGVTDLASTDVTIIHKADPTHPEIVTLSYKTNQLVRADVQVLPSDTVIVAKAGVVYVLGDVGRPGGFLIEDNQPLTVLRALSLAQGINKTAKLNAAVILRDASTGEIEYRLPLKKMLEGKAADVSLGDRDVLYVPSSLGKTLGYRGIELAAQATAGIIIYRP